MVEQDLMVFWTSSEFPYLKWGTVIDFDVDGKVIIEEDNYAKEPVRILPKNYGELLANHLEKLKEAHELAKNNFETDWKNKLNSLYGDYKIPRRK